jgi:biotin carboxyl carrier protein
MKREVLIEGKKRLVEIDRRNGSWTCAIDGQAVDADVVEIAPGVYSILLGGQVLEARVEPTGGRLQIHVGDRRLAAEVIDPRRWRRRRGETELEGRQEIQAPMPGKVVRVLAAQGEAVEAGQGILVLEAMKMQNEVRSPKSGKLERLLVSEGQPVNAGDALAVVA